MSDLLTALKGAKLPERIVPICLDGDLLGQLVEAEDAYLEAMQRAVTTEQSKPAEQHRSLDELAKDFQAEQEAVNAAQEAVKAAQVDVRLRALAPHAWASLTAEHPPREGNAGDEQNGVNSDTFAWAMVRASMVPPLDDDDWQQLVDLISGPEMERLITAATALSRRKTNLVPFSFGASAPTETSKTKPAKRAASA